MAADNLDGLGSPITGGDDVLIGPSSAKPRSCDCCHETDKARRNLIVCIDGTDNQFGDKNTNVIELYSLILKGKDDNQLTWYNSGIGTYVRHSWASVGDFLVLSDAQYDFVCRKFEKTILGAYRWLSDNYQHGDCIFLFGFSRGAFQVRVLSAMIAKVGLIYKGNEMQIPFAYELYQNSDNRKSTEKGVRSADQNLSAADRFKLAFSYEDVQVHFVGAWDTVSSIGLTRRKAMLPGTVDGMKHVCYFRHALALDERRVKFLPEYSQGGLSRGSGKVKEAESQDLNDINGRPRVLEVWFPGTHSDIGGGNVENTSLNRSSPPLQWMVQEAGIFGLRTKRLEPKLVAENQIQVKDSLTLFWWPLEIMAFRRLTYTDEKRTTYKPHVGSGRRIHDGQKIHQSFMVYHGDTYVPKARPTMGDVNFWKKCREDHGTRSIWLESDFKKYAGELVNRYQERPRDQNLIRTLHDIAITVDGLHAVAENVYAACQKHDIKIEFCMQLLLNTSDIIARSSRALKLGHSRNIKIKILEALNERKISKYEARSLLQSCMDFELGVGKEHNGFVHSVSFHPSGKWLVSGSNDHCVLFWDAALERAMKVQHLGFVTSVSCSHDGKWVASGSYDSTMRIWEIAADRLQSQYSKNLHATVTSIVFSPDDKIIASCSADKTIRMWGLNHDGISEEPVAVAKLTGQVLAAQFSSNGDEIISVSSDCRIQTWEVKTGGEILQRHWKLEVSPSSIQSVVLSSNGKLMVVGSDDGAVRIWDTQKHTMENQLLGHTGRVSAVAFSTDGARVASGSNDDTIRIWDVHSGEILRVLTGHTGRITSVAFSPDSEGLVSGSSDRTVRTWGLEIVSPDSETKP